MLAQYSAVWVLKSESFFPPFPQNVFCKMESFFLFQKKNISLRLELTLQSTATWNTKEEGKYSWERVKVNVELHGMGFLFVWGGPVVANEVEWVIPPLLRKKSSFYIFGKFSFLSRMPVTVFVLMIWRSCMALVSS
jgi:hypothetical protein